MNHLLVHYLDLARHEAVSTLSWEAVKTNIGASVWLFVGVTLTWPKVRRFVFGELHASLDALHKHLGSKPPTR